MNTTQTTTCGDCGHAASAHVVSYNPATGKAATVNCSVSCADCYKAAKAAAAK